MKLIFVVLAFCSVVSAANIGNWTVTQTFEGRQYTCIKMLANLTLLIEYQQKDTANASIASIKVSDDAVVDETLSTCNYNFTSDRLIGDEQLLVLNFGDDFRIWFKFTNNTVLTNSNADVVDVYQVRVHYTLTPTYFPNAVDQNMNKTVYNFVNKTTGAGALKLFAVMSDRSYACKSNVSSKINSTITLETEMVRLEAYMHNTTSFQRQMICSADLKNEKSDLIPIIIGAALAALVVVVLVAYLIGRARTKRTVYETI